MIRRIIVNIIVSLHLVLDTLCVYPLIWICQKLGKQSAALKLAEAVAKSWGRWFLRPTKSKIVIIYEDDSIKERLKIAPFLLVANHQSNMDIPFILGYFFRPVAFIAKLELTKVKILHLWMSLAGCVFLDRSNPRSAVKTMKEAAEKIKQGKAMAIFPEGTRSSQIQTFKKGSLKLALSTGVPIVPVTLVGTDKIYKRNPKRVNINTTITMYVHKEILVDGLTKEQVQLLPELVQNKIEVTFNRLTQSDLKNSVK